jgi:Plasmid maintenance system killer protein
MEITFKKEYLQELYETGKTTEKRYRFQPYIVAKYRKTIDILEAVSGIEDLYKFNSLCYEELLGNKKGISSVRINDQYRIEFIVNQVISETVITVCNIIELSNHYK